MEIKIQNEKGNPCAKWHQTKSVLIWIFLWQISPSNQFKNMEKEGRHYREKRTYFCYSCWRRRNGKSLYELSLSLSQKQPIPKSGSRVESSRFGWLISASWYAKLYTTTTTTNFYESKVKLREKIKKVLLVVDDGAW